jgi:hypothetical protein
MRKEVLGWVRENRELNPVGLWWQPVKVGELPSEMIECGAQVIDGLADDEAELLWWRNSHESDAVPTSLRLELGADRVGVGCDVLPEFVVKGLQIHIDASELGAGAVR